jgi:hypothetical protein
MPCTFNNISVFIMADSILNPYPFLLFLYYNFLKTQIIVKEHERLFNITLKTQIIVKEHERLFNITFKTQIIVKEQLKCNVE